MPKLTLLVPDEEPMKIAFDDQPEVTVGRAEDNHIVLTHDSISGHHAKLQLAEDGGYLLVDLDSTNGTFFDGAPAANNPLHNGAQIAFGQVPATFETEDGAPIPDATDVAAEPEAAPAAASDFSDTDVAGGDSLSHSIHAEAAANSARPAAFKNLSPLGKVEKKDSVGMSIMLVGVVALLAALATLATAFIMSTS